MHSLVHEHYLRAQHAERVAARGLRRGGRRWRHLPPTPPPPRPPRRGGGVLPVLTGRTGTLAFPAIEA
jgi:hypothetical protein